MICRIAPGKLIITESHGSTIFRGVVTFFICYYLHYPRFPVYLLHLDLEMTGERFTYLGGDLRTMHCGDVDRRRSYQSLRVCTGHLTFRLLKVPKKN